MSGLGGWTEFIAAFAVFFTSHGVPVRPPVRPWLEARLGAGGFTLLYSGVSLGVLTWLIIVAGRAPYVPLWTWAAWQNGVTLALMLPACLLLALSVGRPNPFSFGGGSSHRFDPARPGPVRWTRHPLLGVLALWSLGHLMPNGNLAHVLVFGSFAAFSVLGGGMIDRRKRRDMGRAWDDLSAAVHRAPILSLRMVTVDTAFRLAAGLALFAVLIALHPHVLGVNPLPW